jgi:hypothetical protein
MKLNHSYLKLNIVYLFIYFLNQHYIRYYMETTSQKENYYFFIMLSKLDALVKQIYQLTKRTYKFLLD